MVLSTVSSFVYAIYHPEHSELPCFPTSIFIVPPGWQGLATRVRKSLHEGDESFALG